MSNCKLDTDGEIDATPEPVQYNTIQYNTIVQPTTQRSKPEKFPKPATMGVEETRERWENFLLNWTQYKEDSDHRGKDVKGSWWHVTLMN